MSHSTLTMKFYAKLFVLVCATLGAAPAWGQFSAGSQFIGGGFSYYAPLTKADTSSSFGINAEYFRFTAANKAWGIRIGYADNRPVAGLTGATQADGGQYFIAPNLQRFFPIVGRFGVFAGLEAVLSYQKTTRFADNQVFAQGSAFGLNINLFTGAYFRAADRLLLRLNIGAAPLIGLTSNHQKLTQADAQLNTLNYTIAPYYSIAGSSLSLFYRLK